MKNKTLQTRFDDMRADYDFMKSSRFNRRRTGLAPGGGSGDYHIRNEEKFYEGIEKCRDIDRNDMIVGQALTRATDNIVQDGFVLDPDTGDKALDNELWAMWKEYSEDAEQVDVMGELIFSEMEHMVCRTIDVDGDILAAGLEDGQIQFHEAHTIKKRRKSKNVHLGVELSDNRRRRRFWIAQDSIDPQKSNLAETSTPLNVRDGDVRVLMHVYNRQKRLSMTRGISELSRIFSMSGMVDDINFAKMVQQQIASCFAVIEELAGTSINDGSSLPSVEDAATGLPQTTGIGPNGEVRSLSGIGPGMYIKSNPGSKLKLESASVPNQEFFAHIRLLLQMMGVNLGIPLVMMLLDGSETNFSGYRGAIDEARRGFRQKQNHLKRRFHTPVYRWKVQQWIEQKKEGIHRFLANKNINLFGHTWQPPTWPYIEPLTDASGDLLRLRNHLISPRRLHAEKSRDYETIVDEITEDNGYAIEQAMKKAEEINKRHPGSNITWRDILQLPMPEGVQVSIPITQPQQQQGQTSERN